ncbi:hypothetical protein HHK36_020642 [Tetracentron sinense]|uniref:Aluminum-activated malate transporter n=1 Tax=Tetracentron sinense TaxID=13715 RepID=A0A834YRZ4_TETSI|nr:hypothetical protein HHK36_020642 [Tetracentron sinense]
MNSTVISIPSENGDSFSRKKQLQSSILSLLPCLTKMKIIHDYRNLIHSIKVGIALVLVSLLYLSDPLYARFGENAMWAIMTVVVIFEFFAGATLSKGLNRGMGTILGGGLGCLAATFAQEVGGIGNSIAVGTSVFIFGAAATYSRLFPNIKRRYDYGVLIFILTFNLVVVSGLRELLRELAATILSLEGCLQSPRQPSSVPVRQSVKEPCEAVASLLAVTLRELGETIMNMRRCQPGMLMVSKLQSMRLELSVSISPSRLGALDNGEGLAIASCVFLLTEMVDKVEMLAKEVEELGDLAGFPPK